jgi:acyl-CoA thioester hydrolase
LDTNEFPTFDYPVLIHEHHLDTFGHVNNAKYLEIFEDARWELITRRGYGLKEVMAKKIGPVILAIEMKFQKELTLREQIIVKTQVNSYSGKIAKMTQTMCKANGDVACTTIFTFGLFDLKARKLIEPTPEWLHAIGLKD